MAKPKPPIHASDATVASCEPAVSAKTMTTVSEASTTSSVRGTETLAARPPSALPTKGRRRRARAATRTAPLAKPLTSVSVYAM